MNPLCFVCLFVLHKASFICFADRNTQVRSRVSCPLPGLRAKCLLPDLRSSLLEFSQMNNNSSMDTHPLQSPAKKKKKRLTELFSFLLLLRLPFSLSGSLRCFLHASPSSQRIYRGEKDLKGVTEEKKKKLNCLLIL